jgi:hypothetical protein
VPKQQQQQRQLHVAVQLHADVLRSRVAIVRRRSSCSTHYAYTRAVLLYLVTGCSLHNAGAALDCVTHVLRKQQ